jgi:hypothetical protein
MDVGEPESNSDENTETHPPTNLQEILHQRTYKKSFDGAR